MKIRERTAKKVEWEGHGMKRRFFATCAMGIAMLLAGGGVARAQEAPEPPEAPGPPGPILRTQEAPEPPEPGQVFVFNDGAAHLGVTLGDVSTEKAQELKLPAVAGAIVNAVQKDSPAAKAGIELGDVITEFDGVRVRSSAELRRLIRETPVGRTVAIKVVRAGKSRELSAKLEGSPNKMYNYNFNFDMPEVRIPPIPPMKFYFGPQRATLGIEGDDLTPQLAQYFGVKQGKGVLISEVTVGGTAERAGLKAGDIIVQVNSKPIGGVDELRSALNEDFTDDTRKVSLTIIRDHHEQTVNAELTRTHTGEKHTSRVEGPNYGQGKAELQAQVEKQRERADQLRALADQERTLRGELLNQTQQMGEEWRRQLREQMLSLKDQLRQMQDYRVTLRRDSEI